MYKFTQGNYEVVGSIVYMLEHDSWRHGKEQMRNRIYANVQGYHETPQTELDATAKLFAASHELLEALEKARNGLLWYQETCPNLVSEDDYEMLEQINKAIEKATK